MVDLKQIQITGGAVEDYSSVMKTGKKKRTTRKNQEVTGIIKHGGASPAALIQLQADSSPSLPNAPQPKGVETTGLRTYPDGPAPFIAPKPLPSLPSLPLVQAPSLTTHPLSTGGSKPKVILELKKKEATKQLPKLKLEAPKKRPTTTSTKKARKIRVSLTNLNKRITRHKKIQKEARLVPIEQIKQSLVGAKLIKVETKAPDTILRQIYADYQALKTKAL